MVNQRLNRLDKLHGVRQGRMKIKRRFVHPMRMQVEELRIARRAKYVEAQASSLGPRRRYNLAQRRLDGTLVTRLGVKAREDVELHGKRTS